jgi:hypothetical protein
MEIRLTTRGKLLTMTSTAIVDRIITTHWSGDASGDIYRTGHDDTASARGTEAAVDPPATSATAVLKGSHGDCMSKTILCFPRRLPRGQSQARRA